MPFVWLTAYTAPVARLLDPHVDVLLVGDSLGMVIYGFESTIPVTLDMMIAHGAAVVRATSRACVIVDMPFGSYQESPAQAFRAAARVLAETGCAGVKLEGGARDGGDDPLPRPARHPRLRPRGADAAGGERVGLPRPGPGRGEAARIMADARAVAEAGAFAIVVEGTYEAAARAITEAVPVPTIGIGASAACDGQVLVSDDLLGLFAAFKPRFVKRYVELGPLVSEAAAAYAADVRARRFPGPEHVFGPPRG